MDSGDDARSRVCCRKWRSVRNGGRLNLWILLALCPFTFSTLFTCALTSTGPRFGDWPLQSGEDPPVAYTFIGQETYTGPAGRDTLMLWASAQSDPNRFRLSARQSDLSDERYQLHIPLDCRRNFSTGAELTVTHDLDEEATTKWYLNGKRLREPEFDQYRFHVQKLDKSELLLSTFQEDRNSTAGLNGVYECAVYRKLEIVTRRWFHLKVFPIHEIYRQTASCYVEYRAKNRDKPKTAMLTAGARGLTWVVIHWTLEEEDYKLNIANVTKLTLHVSNSRESITRDILFPADIGSYNVTNLTQDQPYKIKGKTWNRQHSIMSDAKRFATDRPADVVCQQYNVTVDAGGNATVLCFLYGRPPPSFDTGFSNDASFTHNTPDKKSHLNKWPTMLLVRWRLMSRASMTTPKTCFDVFNIYRRNTVCITKTIHCRPPG